MNRRRPRRWYISCRQVKKNEYQKELLNRHNVIFAKTADEAELVLLPQDRGGMTPQQTEPTAKEQDEYDDMKLVREMYARGYSFHRLDLYKAKAVRCTVFDGKIMPAISSVGGLGDTQAEAVEKEAKKGRFLSKDDFRERTKVSKTIIDLLDDLGILSDLPESNQISLFDAHII